MRLMLNYYLLILILIYFTCYIDGMPLFQDNKMLSYLKLVGPVWLTGH